MIEFKNTNNYGKSNLNDELKRDYIKALKNIKFKNLVNRLKITDEIGMKYTSKLEHTINDLHNCENCKGLVECKNDVNGCVYYPEKVNDKLVFNYVACKYKNKDLEETRHKKSLCSGVGDLFANASMSDIYTDDKQREKVIKWILNYIKEYKKGNFDKGLYLHGNFGCGKTYLLAAMLNELAKNG